MGWLDKLLGVTRSGGPSHHGFDAEGRTCARCGKPIRRENLGLETGSGLPVHRKCPPVEDPED